MNVASSTTSASLRTGMLLAWFAASVLVAVAVIIGLREIGILPDPETLTAQKSIRELVIRLILLLFLGGSYAAIALNESTREWFLAQRWRTLALILFALGAVTAMADPFHPISGEGNWIRYWTSGALLVAGSLAIFSATQNIHPLPDRFFGASFGLLLVAAGGDEIFQVHEQAGRSFAAISPFEGVLHANDVFTLGVAIGGALVLGALIMVRSYGGWLGGLLRQQRFRLPLQLFSLAVLAFLAATMLDSLDIYLQDAVDSLNILVAGAPPTTEDRLWLALADAKELANAVEELLEFLSAICLLMMIGNLFSIDALGAEKSTAPA